MLSEFVSDKIQEHFAGYGLGATKLLVENISLPESVEKALDNRRLREENKLLRSLLSGEESFERLILINLQGPTFLTQLVANRMMSSMLSSTD